MSSSANGDRIIRVKPALGDHRIEPRHRLLMRYAITTVEHIDTDLNERVQTVVAFRRPTDRLTAYAPPSCDTIEERHPLGLKWLTIGHTTDIDRLSRHRNLSAHLPRPASYPFIRRQPLQCDRTTRMQTAGSDADLRAEPEFPTVGKLGRRVPQDDRAVHAS